MKLRIAWTVIVFSTCASSQPQLAGLVLPLANAPLTVEQVEERTSRLPDTRLKPSVCGAVYFVTPQGGCEPRLISPERP
jgi:hypothetical protein